jgi:hypothetical protein
MPIYIARNSKEQTKRNKLTLTLFHSHKKNKPSSKKMSWQRMYPNVIRVKEGQMLWDKLISRNKYL